MCVAFRDRLFSHCFDVLLPSEAADCLTANETVIAAHMARLAFTARARPKDQDVSHDEDDRHNDKPLDKRYGR